MRRIADAVAPMARARGKSLADLAVAWTLRRPELSGAIIGVRSPAEARAMKGGLGWVWAEDELEALDAATAAPRPAASSP